MSARHGNIMKYLSNVAPPPQSDASVNRFSTTPSRHSSSSDNRRPPHAVMRRSHHAKSSLHLLFNFTFADFLVLPLVLLISSCRKVLPCGAICATHIKKPISDCSSFKKL